LWPNDEAEQHGNKSRWWRRLMADRKWRVRKTPEPIYTTFKGMAPVTHFI
jgi:hypothetical protein